MLSARRWPTAISPAQFQAVTQLQEIPAWLRKDVQPDGTLHVYANGEINYTLHGVHAKVSVLWNFEAPAGAGDTHYSVMRGAIANLVIRQGKEQAYQPVLYIEPLGDDRHRDVRDNVGARDAAGAGEISGHWPEALGSAAGKLPCPRPIT